MNSYQLVHAVKGCESSEIEVSSDAITKILEVSDSVLLLKIVPGDSLEELRIKLVQYSSDTPYIAISHVWADGLGNPISKFATSLSDG